MFVCRFRLPVFVFPAKAGIQTHRVAMGSFGQAFKSPQKNTDQKLAGVYIFHRSSCG